MFIIVYMASATFWPTNRVKRDTYLDEEIIRRHNEDKWALSQFEHRKVSSPSLINKSIHRSASNGQLRYFILLYLFYLTFRYIFAIYYIDNAHNNMSFIDNTYNIYRSNRS